MTIDACAHDGWQEGCPHCEAQQREAMQWMGQPHATQHETYQPDCAECEKRRRRAQAEVNRTFRLPADWHMERE